VKKERRNPSDVRSIGRREREKKKEPPKIKRQHLKIRKQTEGVTALPVKGKGKNCLNHLKLCMEPEEDVQGHFLRDNT